MESKKLEALLMAVDLGSFTKAAEVLGYTQSGLTHMMNSLEKEIGFTLLDRGRNGVSFTEEGERIAPAIRDFLQANARLDNAIAQVAGSHSEVIRLAAYASMTVNWLPSIIERFRDEYPDVSVDIRMLNIENSYEMLLQGKMDAIFVSRQEEKGYDWVHLMDDRMYAVLPPNYSVGDATNFPIENFIGNNFIMPTLGYDKDIMRIFNRFGVKPTVSPTMVDDFSVISMVEHGLGVSMLSELTLKGRSGRAVLLPVEPESSRELGIAVRSGAELSPALRRFLTLSQQVVGELLQRESEEGSELPYHFSTGD